MQSIRDAVVLLGVVLLVASVRIVPDADFGEIVPVGQAVAAESETATGGEPLPALRLLPDRPIAEQPSEPGSHAHARCVRVETLKLDGNRMMLRIDSPASRVDLQATAPGGQTGRTAKKTCEIG